MCILNLFHSNHQLLLVGFLGGGLVLGLIATSLVVRDILHHLTGDLVKDAATTTEQDRDKNTSVVSDHAYVEQLLLKHDGQLHQQHIVMETGWSKAKVSMLLSAMAADEQLTKIRLGRENLIVLPGHEPEFLTSAWNADEDHP